jgi:hypothetical protein
MLLGMVQIHKVGTLVYFFDKLLYMVIVFAFVALGAAAPLLARLARTVDSQMRVDLVVVMAIVLAIAFSGGINPRIDTFDGSVATPRWQTTWGSTYITGRLIGYPTGRLAYRVYRNTPNDGRYVLVKFGTDRDANIVLHLAVLHRHAGGDNWLKVYWWSWGDKSPADFTKHITETSEKRFRVVTDDPALLDAMRQLARDQPDLGLDVVDFRTLPPL